MIFKRTKTTFNTVELIFSTDPTDPTEKHIKQMIILYYKTKTNDIKRMNKYANGKIYAIRSPNSDDVYIGSTRQALSKRFHQHKLYYGYFKKGQKKAFTSSVQIFEKGDAFIELVELYPCSCKSELGQREGQIMRKTDNCINKVIQRVEPDERMENLKLLDSAQRQKNDATHFVCSTCKCWKPRGGFEIKLGGEAYKTCFECRLRTSWKGEIATKRYKQGNIQCSSCKCFKDDNSFHIKPSGKRLKTCEACCTRNRVNYKRLQQRTAKPIKKPFVIYNGKAQYGSHIVPDLGQEARVIVDNIDNWLV